MDVTTGQAIRGLGLLEALGATGRQPPPARQNPADSAAKTAPSYSQAQDNSLPRQGAAASPLAGQVSRGNVIDIKA